MVEKLYDLLLFVILHSPGFTPFTAVVPTTASFKADHVTASLKILPLSLSPTGFLRSANQPHYFHLRQREQQIHGYKRERERN